MLQSSKNTLLIVICLLVTFVNIGLYYKVHEEKALTRKKNALKPTIERATSQTSDQTSAVTIFSKSSTGKETVEYVSSQINHAEETENAFEKFGYANISFMNPMTKLRALQTFPIIPWKILANDSEKNAYQINWSMIVVVKSHPKHPERRKVIRKTWGSFKHLNGVYLHVVFIVGKGGSTEIEMDLAVENETHGDILQADMDEVYEDVGLKVLAGMQWVSQNFSPHWIYSSADDDVLPNLIDIYKDMEKLMALGYKQQKLHATNSGYIDVDGGKATFQPQVISDLPVHCGYIYSLNAEPDRGPSKWGITKTTYPLSKFPPFCHGGWYSMPVALASGIYNVSRRHEYFRLDDVWITGLLRLSYFSAKNDNEYFGLKKSDENIGVWNLRHEVVLHLYDEKAVRGSWRKLEMKILNQAREYSRTDHTMDR